MTAATLYSSSVPAPHGRTVPRRFTPPLVTGAPGPCGCGCALTSATSYGFEVADFAAEIGRPYDPWQRWCVIHAGELLPDGRPRFRRVLVLVARQNGKTELLVPLAAYWLFVLEAQTVLGTSTKLEYAQDSWKKLVKIVRRTSWLMDLLPSKKPFGIYQANGQVRLELAAGGEYRIAPADEEGGRSKTVDLAILDELRQHTTYASWDAVIPAQSAVSFAQAWCLSNAGSDRSIVLNDLLDIAVKGIETGGAEGDQRLFLAEWSAPDGSDPEDVDALLQANPSIGYRQDLDDLMAEGRAAKAKGGDKLAGYLTERMCVRVRNLDPAIDPQAWAACSAPGTLDDHRARVVLCMDVAIDALHATVVAAAVLPDGRVRVEPVQAWDGPTCGRDMARALPALVDRVRPRAVGWFPTGPAAELAADLVQRPGWPPAGVTVAPIRADTTAVCMGLEALVRGTQLAHSDDPLLDDQVSVAEKLWQGDAWRFTRKGAGHVDAVYAAAGAVHLARTLPSVGKPRLVMPRP